MNVGMETIRERMAEYLNGQGVEARTAWPEGERKQPDGPVVLVSLRACKVGAGGFQDYLGERYNEETGLWEELYGRKAELTFGLDLYAPARGDGADLQAAFDRLAAALTRGGPEGLAAKGFSCGETEYDSRARLCKRGAQAVYTAWLCAAPQPGQAFVDFELRGGLTT